VHERYRRQTDDRRQTDRRQTDGRATAYSEREREFTFANKTAQLKLCFRSTHSELELQSIFTVTKHQSYI